jgi:hypothetical protein
MNIKLFVNKCKSKRIGSGENLLPIRLLVIQIAHLNKQNIKEKYRMKNTITICVAKDGTKDFQSISEALMYASKHYNNYIVIKISNGVYKEKLWINQENITFIGEDKDKTRIEYDDYAKFIMEDGEKRGTFRTPSVFVDCNDFTAKNITFSNTSGSGPKVGQALALYVDGNRIILKTVSYLEDKILYLQLHFPRLHMKIMALKDQKNLHHVYMVDIIIKTALYVVMWISYLEVQLVTLINVNYSLIILVKKLTVM